MSFNRADVQTIFKRERNQHTILSRRLYDGIPERLDNCGKLSFLELSRELTTDGKRQKTT